MGCTKTDFMRGMQCERMLWLDKHHPELKVIPPETQMKLDRGNEFGDKAMGMFGPFVEMTAYKPNTSIIDKKKMVINTKHHLDIGTENICEAAFDCNGNYCAVDILHKVDGGYEMYEVKDSPEVRQQHIHDAGYQSFILKCCGIDLKRVFIVYHGEDEDYPFVEQDITDEAEAYSEVVRANLDRLNAVREQRFEPDTEPGDQCAAPYPCWYCSHCGAK